MRIGEGEKFDFSVIKLCFSQWLERYQAGRYARLVQKSNPVLDNCSTRRAPTSIGGVQYLFIKLFNRFMADYRVNLKRKLAFLHFVKFKTFLTLTVDPKKFLRLSDEYLFVSKAWSKLRQAEGRHHRFFYLRILEITKKGRPHLHILTTIPFIDIKRVRKLWVKYGGGVICKVRRCGDRLNGLSYLLKYVTKALCIPGAPTSPSLHEDSYCSLAGKSARNPERPFMGDPLLGAKRRAAPWRGGPARGVSLYGPILFASNRRLFSFNDVRTRCILDKSPLTKCDFLSLYDYNGTVTSFLLEAYCREFDIKIADRIEILPGPGVLSDWKDLFGYYYEEIDKKRTTRVKR